MRRGNGQGSLVKVTGRRKPWRALVCTGKRDANGNYARTLLGYYASRTEAEAALKQWNDNPIEKPNITLAEVFSEWQEKRFAKISKQTRDNYLAAWKRFSPLYDQKMRNIRSGQLQSLLDNEEGSQSTKQKIRTLAVQLWDYALFNDIVTKNYAHGLEIENRQKTERKIFNSLQRKKIEKAAFHGDLWAKTIVMLYYTGFRINEFLSLTPFSIIRDDKGKPLAFHGGLKTIAGKDRIVPIHKKIQPFLAEWLNKKGKYIVCNENGDRISYSTYLDHFKKTLAALGMDGFTPHATRHTFFTLADEAGLSEAKIMKIGGHSDIDMTKYYTHAEIDTLVTAINTIQ